MLALRLGEKDNFPEVCRGEIKVYAQLIYHYLVHRGETENFMSLEGIGFVSEVSTLSVNLSFHNISWTSVPVSIYNTSLS